MKDKEQEKNVRTSKVQYSSRPTVSANDKM